MKADDFTTGGYPDDGSGSGEGDLPKMDLTGLGLDTEDLKLFGFPEAEPAAPKRRRKKAIKKT